MVSEIALVIGAYLLGSLPYMLLIGRARGVDLSQEGDLHSALWHKVGRIEGFSGVLVDILKGVIPVVVGFALHLHLAAIAASGFAAVAGQMWPVFRKFDGEKGNTTAIGVITALTIGLTLTKSPLAYLVFITFAVPVLIGTGIRTIPRLMAPGQTLSQRFMFGGPASNSMPLGMFTGFLIAPLASWCLKQPLEMTLAFAAIFIAIIIRRLTANLSTDLKTATISTKSILINRLFYDRSYL